MSFKSIKTAAERFEEKYTIEPNTGCWLWTAGSRNDQGYGQFWIKPKMICAHRWALENKLGREITLDVLHKCDTPECVNPDHLFEGTHEQNMQDMKKKGRARDRLGRVIL